jgi:hypothetical protein
MATHDEIIQPYVATIETEGRRYNVSVRIVYDGIEYVGRLWFADEPGTTSASPTAAAPGSHARRSHFAGQADVAAGTGEAPPPGLAEKRRFLGLRKHTDEILAKIRYLNQVAISMRAGLLDVEGAAQEIDLTEKQLHTLIDTLSEHAGKED